MSCGFVIVQIPAFHGARPYIVWGRLNNGLSYQLESGIRRPTGLPRATWQGQYFRYCSGVVQPNLLSGATKYQLPLQLSDELVRPSRGTLD